MSYYTASSNKNHVANAIVLLKWNKCMIKSYTKGLHALNTKEYRIEQYIIYYTKYKVFVYSMQNWGKARITQCLSLKHINCIF
jgi:hypothetical protein